MSRQLEMEAEALITIIAKIQRLRRTGLLMTQRSNGSELEEGSITFVNGQVTGSQLGRRKGKDAFNAMSQWKHCQFTFLSPNQEDAALFAPPPKPPPIYQSSPLRGPTSVSEVLFEKQDLEQPERSFGAAIPIPRVSFEQARPVLDELGSRHYRQVFLLIDGQRPVAELQRLVGRDPNELAKILYDLERVGAIHIQR